MMRTSPNVLYVGDRVMIHSYDSKLVGRAMGTVRGFEGDKVLVQPDGWVAPYPFEWGKVS